MKFQLPRHWLDKTVQVQLVGAGGNGSHMLDGLITLNFTLRKLGHPGLMVTVYDPDEVSETNIARSQFYKQDIGHNKAIVLVNRINQFHNLNWQAIPCLFDENVSRHANGSNLVISCVDSVKARREIHSMLAYLHRMKHPDQYWLDMGNGADFAQVILGQYFPPSKREPVSSLRLRTVTDLYPEMLNPESDPVDDLPSCSVTESIHRQSMFINKTAATYALYLLSSIFTEGGLDSHHGYFINMKSGTTAPLKIDPDTWRRMQGKKPIRKKAETA
jgi:PRTRC genetic system ThiF family protein